MAPSEATIALATVVPVGERIRTWSNYRFPGSGITVVSVIENELSGLFVLRPQLAGEKKRGGPPR